MLEEALEFIGFLGCLGDGFKRGQGGGLAAILQLQLLKDLVHLLLREMFLDVFLRRVHQVDQRHFWGSAVHLELPQGILELCELVHPLVGELGMDHALYDAEVTLVWRDAFLVWVVTS